MFSRDRLLQRQAARRQHLTIGSHADFLLAVVEEQPDLTLDEVICAMRRHKIPGSRTAVWRFFQRHKITFKKSAAGGGAGTRGRGARSTALDARTGHV